MNLALFDFDHTISFKDSFAEFLQFSLTPTQKMKGITRLAPWLLAYKVGVINDQAIRQKLCAVAYSGYDVEKLNELGQQFAQSVLPNIIRKQAAERILWHQQQGDTICVVSSSLNVYLQAWCEQQGLDLICNQIEVVNARYTGHLIFGDCGYAEKARRVEQKYHLNDFDKIYAYGDSPNDHAMLALADKKYYGWVEQS